MELVGSANLEENTRHVKEIANKKGCYPLQKLDKNVVLISNEIGGHQDLCCNSPTSPSATNKRDSDYCDHV